MQNNVENCLDLSQRQFQPSTRMKQKNETEEDRETNNKDTENTSEQTANGIESQDIANNVARLMALKILLQARLNSRLGVL